MKHIKLFENSNNNKTMKEKELFIKSIETLLYSWGSDTPNEVIWGLILNFQYRR